MAASGQRLADLEDQVAALAAEVRDLREKAFVFRAVEDIFAGTPLLPRGRRGTPRAPRARHLRAVDGGA